MKQHKPACLLLQPHSQWTGRHGPVKDSCHQLKDSSRQLKDSSRSINNTPLEFQKPAKVPKLVTMRTLLRGNHSGLQSHVTEATPRSSPATTLPLPRADTSTRFRKQAGLPSPGWADPSGSTRARRAAPQESGSLFGAPRHVLLCAGAGPRGLPTPLLTCLVRARRGFRAGVFPVRLVCR